MSHFFTNRFSDYSFLTGLIILLCLLQACQSETDRDMTDNRKFQRINLFSQDTEIVYDNTGKLSFEEAFQASEYVLLAADIIKIDSSATRGVRPFYVYRIDQGKIEKSKSSQKWKFPVYFVSEDRLFRGTYVTDSVYLFLSPLKDYAILKNNSPISYQWLYDAPFVGR